MSTEERELTAPVDLCTADGLFLSPEARGWSRFPLHRANLTARPGTNKRWDYWAILAGDLVVSSVFSDIDHFGLADVYWADLVSGEAGGLGIVVPAATLELPEWPGTKPLRVHSDGLDLQIVDDATDTRLTARWTEPDGRSGYLDIHVDRPIGHESLNVVIPWSDTLFNFTSKQQARPAVGELVIGERRWPIGAPNGPESWGVLDVGRGRWPSEISWNWGGGAGRCGDRVIGLQMGGKWTEGTGFTENGFLIDSRLTKLGSELDWDYAWDEPMRPWRVHDPGGQLAIVLAPRFDKYSHVEAGDLSSETHQVFGTWSGRLTTDDGLTLEFQEMQGFAEEARQRW